MIFASLILTIIAIVQSATLRDETNISTQPVRREANQIQHSDSQNIATCLGRSLGSHKREASPIEEQAVKNVSHSPYRGADGQIR